MRAFRILGKLTAYYVVIGLLLLAAFSVFPNTRNYLPVGGATALITQADNAAASMSHKGANAFQVRPAGADPVQHVRTLGDSLFWLIVAIVGALVTSLPASWVYMEIRAADEYDQSLIGTIIMLPIVVTSIVIIVQNSLALAFSLAGIAGAVRFRNSLKSSGDALFILLAVGIGLSAGIGALELAMVMSIAFNYCFLILWLSEYGERREMKRYMSDYDPTDETAPLPAGAVPAGGPAQGDAKAKSD